MEAYITQLLKDAGVPNDLEPEVKDQLVADITERVHMLINRRLIESLSEEDIAALDKITDEKPDDAQAVQQFIQEHVPDAQNVVTQAMLEFRQLYLAK